ncbi:MAG TPA: hypothetical protein VGB63_16235 [Pedobacter sp.]|jgi:hypothetical protein
MKEKIILKVERLISEANSLLKLINEQTENPSISRNKAFDEAKFSAFRTATLSFINSILGSASLYYGRFDSGVKYYTDYNLVLAVELLTRIKEDVKDGWLTDVKSLLSAELFNDFLEMAEHLISEDYKDASAVIIGSVLEENLRLLCVKNKIDIIIFDPKTSKPKYKKAETLNVDLCKEGVYNILVQKNVTSWLALRNSAAHGKYQEYDLSQVNILLHSVRDFAAKFL